MPTGTILFTNYNAKGSLYGFVTPDDGDGSRETNIWFGELAAWSENFRTGDRVEYELGKPRPDGAQVASRVTLIERAKASA